jgi:hypothetical protein
LYQHTKNYSFNEVTNLSIAWSLSEEAYKTATTGMATSAVIYGVPVGTNYSDFRSNITKRAESLKLDNFEHRAIAYATSGLDANGLGAYKACLLQEGGMELVAAQIGKSSYQISLVYNPVVTGQRLPWKPGDFHNLTLQSAKMLASKIAAIPAGYRIDRTFTVIPADPKQEVTIDVALGDVLSKSLLLPPLNLPPPPPPPPTPVVTEKTLTQKVFEGAPTYVVIDDSTCGNIGTLLCGERYAASYNHLNNTWTVSGYNLGTRANGTWSYSNAPPQPGNLSLWGEKFTFDDAGLLYYHTKKSGSVSLH